MLLLTDADLTAVNPGVESNKIPNLIGWFGKTDPLGNRFTRIEEVKDGVNRVTPLL
jgi:hypothetical protein